MNADGANEIVAGALRIECVELSRTGFMGIKLFSGSQRCSQAGALEIGIRARVFAEVL